MMKSSVTIIVLILQLFFLACNGGEKQNSYDSAGIGPGKDTTSTTKMPDTMYDNSNQDSIP